MDAQLTLGMKKVTKIGFLNIRTWRRTINEEMEKCGKVWREVKTIATNRVRWKVRMLHKEVKGD